MSGSGKPLMRRIFGGRPSGHGPRYEAVDGWVDPKPYRHILSRGIFEGYDGTLWKYWRVPQNVRLDWLKRPEEAITNQVFLTQIMDQLGEDVNTQTERNRGDERRSFHIQFTQEASHGIVPYDGCPPAHADYLRRLSSQYSKPEWWGYMGIQLRPSSIFYEAYGMRAWWQRYMEAMTDSESLDLHLYREEIDYLNGLMEGFGFTELEFDRNPDDLRRLTAWHGIADDDFALPQQLVTTRMREPNHGHSVLVPREWGGVPGEPDSGSHELAFYAIKPAETMTTVVDPASEIARWSGPLYKPGSNVVCINIRGQVRAQRVANNLFELRHTRRQEAARKGPGLTTGSAQQNMQDVSQLEIAQTAVGAGHAFLDNVEMVVAVAIEPGNPTRLPQLLQAYHMEARPLLGRQPQALMSTFPTYPRPIFPVRRSNISRSPLSNQMLAGVLAMSGLFRSTPPCDAGGLLLGLSDSDDRFGGYEYREVYTTVEAAYEKNAVPGMLITGRPGAGKTQQLLQMTAQSVYQGYPVFYLNPKPDATLRPVFEHLGGTTINMSTSYLEDNPGLMDPMFFFRDRQDAATALTEAIISARKMNQDTGSVSAQEQSRLAAEILDNVLDPRNRCSGDVIFGNGRTDERATVGIGDDNIRQFVQNRMSTSPFWRAFISHNTRQSDLRERLKSGRSTLIEWEGSMDLPGVSTPAAEYTSRQVDSILSVTLAFQYAVEIIGDQRGGGVLMVDEAWTLKSSEEIMRLISKGAREWRQRNIMLTLGTQRITDFLSRGVGNMATYFARFLLMAIQEGDDEELEAFFEITKLPRSGGAGAKYREYIVNAGVDPTGRRGGAIPRAYYVDRIQGWEGGVLCGPWPERELNLGRTDAAGERARQQDGETAQHFGMHQGVLADQIRRDMERQGAQEEQELAVAAWDL